MPPAADARQTGRRRFRRESRRGRRRDAQTHPPGSRRVASRDSGQSCHRRGPRRAPELSTPASAPEIPRARRRYRARSAAPGKTGDRSSAARESRLRCRENTARAQSNRAPALREFAPRSRLSPGQRRGHLRLWLEPPLAVAEGEALPEPSPAELLFVSPPALRGRVIAAGERLRSSSAGEANRVPAPTLDRDERMAPAMRQATGDSDWWLRAAPRFAGNTPPL